MGNRIEWGEIGGPCTDGDNILTDPLEVVDDHGNTNERYALTFEGICIEGDLSEFRSYGAALAFQAGVIDEELGVHAPLSPTERVVCGLAARGYTMRRIAAELTVSPRTIECQIRAVYEKCGVTSRDELIDFYWGGLNRG